MITFDPLTGVILRDSHGVAQVKLITGNKILRILKSKGASIKLAGMYINLLPCVDYRVGPRLA